LLGDRRRMPVDGCRTRAERCRLLLDARRTQQEHRRQLVDTHRSCAERRRILPDVRRTLADRHTELGDARRTCVEHRRVREDTRTASAVLCSILARTLDVLDDDHFHWPRRRLQPETELLPDRGKESGPGIRRGIARCCEPRCVFEIEIELL
jgi:hypothetical protein